LFFLLFAICILDFSFLTAQKREGLAQDMCHLFVLDPTTEIIQPHVPDCSVDVAILIFVLSAIAPKHMESVLAQIWAVCTDDAWSGFYFAFVFPV
jgi:hypothetical protein